MAEDLPGGDSALEFIAYMVQARAAAWNPPAAWLARNSGIPKTTIEALVTGNRKRLPGWNEQVEPLLIALRRKVEQDGRGNPDLVLGSMADWKQAYDDAQNHRPLACPVPPPDEDDGPRMPAEEPMEEDSGRMEEDSGRKAVRTPAAARQGTPLLRKDAASQAPDDRPYPLDVLVIGAHRHSGKHGTAAVLRELAKSPCVRSFGSIGSCHLDDADPLIRGDGVNTIFMDPTMDWTGRPSQFIAEVRERYPRIVFVLFAEDGAVFQEWLSENQRRAHYLHVLCYPRDEFEGDFARALASCESWHLNQHDFDVAVSFSGEDRAFARNFSSELDGLGARVFFDEYFKHELLGKNLFSYLHEVYSRRSWYCAILVSQSYAAKVWASHELRSAQERALAEGRVEYLLPIILERAELPGIPSTTGFIEANGNPREAARVVAAKLWPTSALAREISGRHQEVKLDLRYTVKIGRQAPNIVWSPSNPPGPYV